MAAGCFRLALCNNPPNIKFIYNCQVLLQVVPWGFRKVLKWISDNYNNVAFIVTENGYSDYGELDDVNRIVYTQVKHKKNC